MTVAGEQYLRPASLPEALSALAAGEFTVLAGGTDVYPAHVAKPLPRALLDITAIGNLRGISREGGTFRFGATTTWNDIARADLPEGFRALQQAAAQVGAIQVQNRGTIGGNLCNASPAADGIPPLLALDAGVELASRSGTRRLPLADFVTGYRTTARRADELVTAIIIPAPDDGARSSFAKLGARKYLVISIVMAAATLTWNSRGTVSKARVVVGAASDRALHLVDLERDLLGLPQDRNPAEFLRPEHFAPLAPISDVRASAGYRRDAAWSLVSEVLAGAR